MNTDDLYRLLRTGHAQAQGIVDTIASPLLVLDADLCVQAANRAFFKDFQVDRYETIGKHLYELGNGQWDIPELRKLLMEVIPRAAAMVDYKVEHAFPGLGRRTMLITARTLFHPDNALQSLLLSIEDVTDRDRRDAARDLQLGEALHRVRNLLGLVRSIAGRTATAGRTADQFRDDFLGRFTALVEAEELAYRSDKVVRLDVLLERILKPYRGGEGAVSVVAGPGVLLRADAVTALGLAFHELATNAAKYGALSRPEGQVRVEWQAEGRNIVIRWTESGGPTVSAPPVPGYGTHLIRGSTTYALGGSVDLDFAPAGLRAEIALPLDKAVTLVEP